MEVSQFRNWYDAPGQNKAEPSNFAEGNDRAHFGVDLSAAARGCLINLLLAAPNWAIIIIQLCATSIGSVLHSEYLRAPRMMVLVD